MRKQDTSSQPATPAGGWADADPGHRRRLIIDVALELLQEQGLEAVTMRNVAGRLGVGTMTLYTYIEGQHGLQRAMVERGFEMLHEHCCGSSTVDQDGDWRGGARAYLRFATEHPNLYKILFDVPLAEDDEHLLHGGFQPLLDHVTELLAADGLTGDALACEARRRAGRYWVALHGLATLAISGRLVVLEGDLDQLLDDILPGVAPT